MTSPNECNPGSEKHQLRFMLPVIVALLAVLTALVWAAAKTRIVHRAYPTIKCDGGAVLITGASSGIGRETALHFLRNGWTVMGTYGESVTPRLSQNLVSIRLFLTLRKRRLSLMA